MKQASMPPALSSIGLILLLTGQLLPMIDFSIVNVALESIANSLHASPAELELVVSVYGVAFAVSLAMGGRLGDNLGRGRLFLFGVALFGVASLLCGIAWHIGVLLLARALQGFSAAMVVPQILATIHVCLRGRDHARALGLYSAIGGIAFVVGQVLGGWLIQLDIAGFGWRSVFLVNLPLCLLVLLFAPGRLPDTRGEKPVALDISGTTLLSIALAFLLFPLALGPIWHWNWLCLAALLLSLVAFILLRWVELRQPAPLLPPPLFKLPGIRFGLLLALLFFSSWSGFMFAVAYTLQSGAGFSPLQSGNSFIGLGLSYFVASLLSGRIAARIGHIRSLLMGCAIQMVGLVLLMATLAWRWPITIMLILPSTMMIGFGQAFIVSSFYRIGLSDVPLPLAGAGSALLSTIQQTSLGLGPILLGSVLVQALHGNGGNFAQALIVTLVAEWGLMLVLVACALRVKYREARVSPAGGVSAVSER
ncbi:MFS transporter [Musicola paradisiaca]|uniref:Major facilitator superfamily MFS_1 n=2 Tax=Musicola paradisiaca TaxID=69223 RepID=C6C4F5_MUSP7|nr:MFS transporter [Musicola paradisiaca]ACS85529.1 major facilitator superfamily MFS_1 [Musicola paradisiaca Ech703]